MTHQAVRGQAVPQRLDTLRELHRSQWGSRSSFLPVFDRFAAGFAGGCDADEVTVHELGNDGLVVAIVAAFEVAGRVSVYQSARLTDGRWRDAATFLLAAIIDDACARGFSEVDFLRGDEPYKGRFAPNHREMVRLVAGKGVVGRFSGGSKAATSQARRTAVRCVRFGRSTVARWKALQAGSLPPGSPLHQQGLGCPAVSCDPAAARSCRRRCNQRPRGLRPRALEYPPQNVGLRSGVPHHDCQPRRHTPSRPAEMPVRNVVEIDALAVKP